MKAPRSRQILGIASGLLLSLIYSAVAGSLPIFQKLELDVQDSLIRLHKPGPAPQNIVVIKIEQSALSVYDLHNLYKLNIFYAALVKSLIANKASVIVLNLPEQMKQYIDTGTDARTKRPLQELIQRDSSQIVLVARPSDSPSENVILNTYNNLLPFDDENTSQSIAPDQIVGYFRYASNPHSLDSPARRVDLAGRFGYEDDLNPEIRHKIKSASALALEKFYHSTHDQARMHSLTSKQPSPVNFEFWGPAGTFTSTHFQLQCPSQIQLEQCFGSFNEQARQALKGKLVLVDLPEGKTLERYSERSPYGELSFAEVQANQIASLMTHSFLETAPDVFDFITTAVGISLMSLYLTDRLSQSKPQLINLLDISLFGGLIAAYTGLALILLWQGIMLPLTIPILGWMGTGVGTLAYLSVRQSVQQRQKLAERQAVLLQTRKLLHRVASDIHDGPLQELKLVMDTLEFFSLRHPALPVDSLLNQLEAIGLDLRNQLNSTRILAEKLEITPDLQFGLNRGIKRWLERLTHSGELLLKVETHLPPLRELKSDSAWFDAREDIFRFFREAVINVIHHAQPPNGAATRIFVSLSQQENRCRLVIENDGPPLTEISENISKTEKIGGYGTKLMTTIADQLPKGTWQRTPLAQGGIRVILEWTMEGF